jgi:phenylpropionate dioxygenase-like ring-hydroxylating dioxygenase large terminal subunit
MDGWQIACRSAALKARPLAVTISDTHLVLFRDGTGQAAALQVRCAHRGAPLSRGRVCDGAIECPYHGWRYGGDGRVVRVPSLPARTMPPDRATTHAFRTVEQQGFVWVALGDTALTTLPHRFAHLGEAGFTSFRMRTCFRATVDACLENFLDIPHATFVHRNWFRAPTARTVRVVVRALADGAEAEYFDEPRERALVWALLAPKQGAMRHTDRFIAPNISQVDYQFANGWRYTITSCCTMRSRSETVVYTVISFRCGPVGSFVRLFFEPLSRLIIRQDVRMLALQQTNVARFPDAGFESTQADVLAPHIRAWRRAMRDGSALPLAGSETHVEMRV